MSELAERFLIGSILIDNGVVKDVMTIVTPDMFTDRLSMELYKASLNCNSTNEEITFVALINRTESIEFPREDIQEYIKEVVSDVITSAGAKGYAMQIRNDYLCRQFTGLMSYTQIDLKASNVEDRIGEMIYNLQSLQENKSTGLRSMSDIVAENKKTHFTENDIKRYETGFEQLDLITGGLEGGDICIVAARPSVGKSAFSTQIAIQMAQKGLKIAIYNLEMRERQIYERLLSNSSKIDLQRVRLATAYLNDEEEKVKIANYNLASLPIFVSSGSTKVSKIENEVRHRDIDVIIIDYLQLIKPERSNGNRVQEVSEIMHDVKALAMTLDIPIIVLSQLNRSLEGRADKEPMMADLRESGDIENDASVIVMLWNLTANRQFKGIKVEKNRNGVLGKIVAEFKGSEMKFLETERKVKDFKQGFRDAEDNPFN